MRETRVTFPSGDLVLEGALLLPDGEGPWPGVVICHPHPRAGGDMHNNVVMAVALVLPANGIACLRFNFRGVGDSQGSHDNGVGEQDDALAAVAYLAARPEIDADRVGLVGYSFGAGVALNAAPRHPSLAAVAAVSGMSRQQDPPIASWPKPKLIVSGDSDAYFSAQDVREFAGRLAEPKELAIVPGADHFWWDYEGDLAGYVGPFFAKWLLASATTPSGSAQ